MDLHGGGCGDRALQAVQGAEGGPGALCQRGGIQPRAGLHGHIGAGQQRLIVYGCGTGASLLGAGGGLGEEQDKQR